MTCSMNWRTMAALSGMAVASGGLSRVRTPGYWSGCQDDSAELLGKPDDDAFRPADVGQPVRVSVFHFADELGPVGDHASDDGVDLVHGEHDATVAQRVHRRIHGAEPDRVGRVKLVE